MTAVTATAPAIITSTELDTLFRLGNALAQSGLFKDTTQAEKALAKILIGRDLGLSPTQALMGIHIIDGKPELSANLQAAFVKQTPGLDYHVATLTETACIIEFTRNGEQLGASTFTMDDARKAGLANRGPWKTYPRNMLFARAMTNGIAFYCPEVTGGVRVYSEGEIGGVEVAPELPELPGADDRDDAPVQPPPIPDAEVVQAVEAAPVNPTAIKQLNGMLNEYIAAGGKAVDLEMQAVAIGGELSDGTDERRDMWSLLTRDQGLALYRYMTDFVEDRKAATPETPSTEKSVLA